MRVFFDTEFTHFGKDTELISIGVVTEHRDSFYAEVTDFNENKCSDFVKENVLPKLIFTENVVNTELDKLMIRQPFSKVKQYFRDWLLLKAKNENASEHPIEIWGDCLSYDWLLFNELFDFELPSKVFYIPFDICTLFKVKKVDPDISRIEFVGSDKSIASELDNEHNSLYDAWVIMDCYDKLKNM